MQKNLSEMSLEELWHLFPVTLTEHKTYWADWYTKEAELLKDILPDSQVARICHIGSTAVTGIWAKPIIDILVETAEHSDLSLLKAPLESGYPLTKDIPKTALPNAYFICTCAGFRIMMNCISAIT